MVDRLDLIQRLINITSDQLGQVIFALNPPKGIIPHPSASQGQRVAALLEWVESPSGCTLEKVERVLVTIITCSDLGQVKQKPDELKPIISANIASSQEILFQSKLKTNIRLKLSYSGLSLSKLKEKFLNLLIKIDEQNQSVIITAEDINEWIEDIELAENEIQKIRKIINKKEDSDL